MKFIYIWLYTPSMKRSAMTINQTQKSILLILLLACLPRVIKAQEISIGTMIAFAYEKDWQKTNMELMDLGWHFDGVREGDGDSYNVITWTYKKKIYDHQVMLFTAPDASTRVRFVTPNIDAYKKIMSELEKHGFLLVDTEYGEYASSTTYQNNIFIYEIALLNQPRCIQYDFFLKRKAPR